MKFTLNKPEAPFIADLAMDFASIVSKEYADKLAEGRQDGPVQPEAGRHRPVHFVDYQPDAVIRYKANPDYCGGKQKIDDLVFAITTDASVRAQKLKAGECDIMPYPNPADIKDLKADANLKVDEQEGLNVGYLAYNTKQTPFDKVEVRKALNMAINKQAIIDAVFQGAGQAAEEPDPADDVVLQRRDQGRSVRSGRGQEGARRGRRQGSEDEDLGDAGCASVHS